MKANPKQLTADRFIDGVSECSYRYVFRETEIFRPHWHDYYEIFIVTEGNCTHIVNNNSIKIKAGDIVFVRPNDIHDYICDKNTPYAMLNISFTAYTAKQLFDFLGDCFPSNKLLSDELPPKVTLTTKQLNYIEKCMAHIRTIDPEKKSELKTQLRILIFNLFTRYFADFDYTLNNDIPIWLSNMCAKFSSDNRFTDGTEYFFSLSDKSREHISRSMKKYMGVTVTEYINTLRLNFIANMLCNSDHNIADIVFESGFNNLGWASELFKARYGMAMSDFRKTYSLN